MDNYNKFKGVYSSMDWDYETPDEFFFFLDKMFGFTLDVCANIDNYKVSNYFTEEDNALSQSWKTKGRWWMNPPWGREYTKKTGYSIGDWMKKAVQEFMRGNEGACIVSARTDTKWWQNWVKDAPYIWFPKGRVAFIKDGGIKTKPNFPSACPLFVKKLDYEVAMKLKSKGMLLVNI